MFPNCCQYISNTKIYIQLTNIPKFLAVYIQHQDIYSTYKYSQIVVQLLDPIQIYILQNVHSPTLRPPTDMDPPSVGRIYPIPMYKFN